GVGIWCGARRFAISRLVCSDTVERVTASEAALINRAAIDGLADPDVEWAIIDRNVNVIERDAASTLVILSGPGDWKKRGTFGRQRVDRTGGRDLIAAGNGRVEESVIAAAVVIEKMNDVFDHRTAGVAEESAVCGPDVFAEWDFEAI